MLTFWILCEIYFTFNTVHVEERKYDYIYFSVASSECGTQDAKNYRLSCELLNCKVRKAVG